MINGQHTKLNELKSKSKNKVEFLTELDPGYFVDELQPKCEVEVKTLFPQQGYYRLKYDNEVIHEFSSEMSLWSIGWGYHNFGNSTYNTAQKEIIVLKDVIKIHKRDYKLNQILN